MFIFSGVYLWFGYIIMCLHRTHMYNACVCLYIYMLRVCVLTWSFFSVIWPISLLPTKERVTL